MSSYASIKGDPKRPGQASESPAIEPEDDFTDEEIERIARNRDFVKKHMPELVDVIKELHAIGFVQGWRCVKNCKLLPAENTTKDCNE